MSKAFAQLQQPIEEFCLHPTELTCFDIYFASVCSMQYHPGAGTKDHKKLTVYECKDIAIEMILARRGVIVYGSEGPGG